MPKIYGNTEILGGDLTVLGNMVISGTQTSLNVEELKVADNIITLNATFSGAPVLDSGIEINRGSGTNSRLIWDETTDYWVAGLSGSETRLLTGSGTTNYIPKWDNNTLSSTSSIYDDGTNVGIGTATPTRALDVVGTSQFKGNALFYNVSGGTATTSGIGMSFGAFGANIFVTDNTFPLAYARERLNFQTSGDFHFTRLNGASLFYIDQSGNVGIGNNTPLYKLQVSGTVSTTGFRMTDGASSGYVLTSDTNGVASWAESSGGISGTGTTNYISKWSSATGLTDSLASSGDTGVGIGTASADNMLTVFGDANVTGDFLIHSDSITTSAGVKGSVTWFDYDGPTVHILSNADTSGTSSVARFMIGDFTTPANKNYGQFAYFPPTFVNTGGSTAYQNMLVMKANSGLAGMILDLDDGGGGTVSILPGRADVVFSESNGFVGVGEVVPVEKLDVLGNVKITGQVYIDIPSTLSPSTNSQAIDWNDGNIQIVDFGSAPSGVTFSFSNPKTGGTYTIKIIQGVNSTSVNWPGTMKWEGGTSLTPTTTNNAVDLVTMVYDGTDYLASYGTNFA